MKYIETGLLLSLKDKCLATLKGNVLDTIYMIGYNPKALCYCK